jgi:hypothetical protein
VTPVYTYALGGEEGVPIESAFSAWRTLLRWLGPPGLLMAALALLTVEEPRQRASKATPSAQQAPGEAPLLAAGAASDGVTAALAPRAAPLGIGESLAGLRGLLASRSFLTLTAAAALNDVGSWALVSWQATFYQRVYGLEAGTYAPLLTIVIPLGGLVGGVGAGEVLPRMRRLAPLARLAAALRLAGCHGATTCTCWA